MLESPSPQLVASTKLGKREELDMHDTPSPRAMSVRGEGDFYLWGSPPGSIGRWRAGAKYVFSGVFDSDGQWPVFSPN